MTEVLANDAIVPYPLSSALDANQKGGRSIQVPPAPERACQMFTAEQYRAKAAEFNAFLANTPPGYFESPAVNNLDSALGCGTDN